MKPHHKGHLIKQLKNAAYFVGAGLLLTALNVYLKSRGVEPEGWAGYGLTLLDHASVALFAAPILGIFIELPHMSDYFRSLIELTIMEKEYLKDLTDEALDEMK